MNVARDRPDAERRASLVDAFRILVGEVADIEHQATDEAVHTARKTAKRARAALRLMRSAIGDAAYHRANKQLRDAARPLTVVRDAVAILGALNHIRKPRDNKRLNSYVSWVYQRLHNEYRASRKEFRQQDIRLSVITLRAVRRRMGHLAASQSDVLSARHGITKTYKNGREASSRARLRPSIHRLHEWRKQAKYLANELDLARRLLRLRQGKARRRAKRLGAVLGDDHDLALLSAKLRESDGSLKGSAHTAERKELERRIQRKRHKLQAQARRVGKRLYGESPRKFGAAFV